MVASAEQYAASDKENRKNIYLKNNAESLCYEANKQLLLIKDTISEDKKNNLTTLIESIKLNIQSEKYDLLETQIEELKMMMKDVINLESINDNDKTN